MSLQSDCDIDPSDIDGLEIRNPAPHIEGMGQDVVVRKVDETTCLVAWASYDETAESPQKAFDQLGEVVILDRASPEQKRRVADALLADDVDQHGSVDPFTWRVAFEHIGDESPIPQDLARTIAIQRPREIVDLWLDGRALQRIIPQEWFVEAAADDPESRQWLRQMGYPPTSVGNVTDRMRARHCWQNKALEDVPCRDELLELACDLGMGQPTREQLEHFTAALLNEGDDRVLFEDFMDRAWYAYWEASPPLGNPDMLEIDYSYHSSAGPIDLVVQDSFSDRIKAAYLFNKDGLDQLDRNQDRAAFASLEKGPNGQPQVHVDPEFLDALDLSGEILEFSDWGQAWDWCHQAEKQQRFCLTARGREIGRQQARLEAARAEVQEYLDWANGNVYACHVERCDRDPETGEWSQTETLECVGGYYGDQSVAAEIERMLEAGKRSIEEEKAQAPVAA
ncbi:hypothetical protein [Thioalkalivibrio sp. ALE16]|uniref:hypothetical protein n=1 Tax=Thioalkalivibrio sp. ALE16 TaxID=1158172 RepID=UPI000361F2D4|nr:hypothetical protein [Thioalkalivibrio sp. ALE16]